ncbi:MAG: 3-oxoacyl-ACP reductase family protein [Thermodesulfobacteriota bacterium]|nr:3-oxoacyl-ACP reductase family protein [Thermodesulfobacteriota bacterium]
MLLEGKNAIVTGSSKGLGRAYAIALGKAGARVVVNGRTASEVDAVVQNIKDEGGEAVACVESVASWEGAQRINQCAKDSFGRLDILVNNAGITRDRTLLKMSEEDWDEVIAIHLKGSFACGKFAALEMKDQGSGRIINITSGAGLLGNFGQTNYSSAKAGIVGMTLTWALELAKYNITVNAMRASAITRMTEPLINRAIKNAKEAGKPAPNPEELGVYPPEAAAPLVVFLASDEASWINGQILAIDGPRLVLWSHPNEVRTAFMFPKWTVETMLKHFKGTIGSVR